MSDPLQNILDKLKQLEIELHDEIDKKRERFLYKIEDKKIHFEEEVKRLHKAQAQSLFRYIADAKLVHIVTAPIIWLILIPTIMLDIFVSLYQAICFPIYGIPKVRRSEYVVIDRQYLAYLNAIEKMNCIYCGYFNGLIAYVREVAARTEKYWCPIKHARSIKGAHDHYGYFVDYGDAKAYKEGFSTLRREFDESKRACEKSPPESPENLE
ncbi:MAG: hypothetical protein P1U80_09745 [Pseudomonadales bacterium]|nr:hypothetical protein [Pseudomonadales bacterium]